MIELLSFFFLAPFAVSHILLLVTDALHGVTANLPLDTVPIQAAIVSE